MVALSGQKQVILYNTETLKISGILPYEEGFIESMKFSRNGKLVIASGGRGGKSGNVAGWDIETGKRVLTVGEEQDSILTADLSADQSLVVIGGTNKLIKVFDLATDEILYKIKKHSEWVTQVAFSPDGILWPQLIEMADFSYGKLAQVTLLHIRRTQAGNNQSKLAC